MSSKYKIAAAIDVGSSAVRMEIAQVSDDVLQTLDSYEYPLNLGKESFNNNKIQFSTMQACCEIINKYYLNDEDIVVDDLITLYRNHKPQIRLNHKNEHLLFRLKEKVFKVGLITDGRSTQQRNKIHALGLSDYFDDVIISEEFGTEKPSLKNFKYFEDKYSDALNYIYVGDNTSKDFIAPNALGWHSICLLDDGKNIHKQSFELEKKNQPSKIITDLLEIELVLNLINEKL